MEKVFLTPEGYDKLKEELGHLQGTRRREVIKAIQAAREHGDLSENAEYDAAKEEQAKRKAAMQSGLKQAVAVPLETAKRSLRAIALPRRSTARVGCPTTL